jgi:hypothetical protein
MSESNHGSVGSAHGFLLNPELIGSDGVDAGECIRPSGCLSAAREKRHPFRRSSSMLGFNEAPQMQSAPLPRIGTTCSKGSNNQGYSEADDSSVGRGPYSRMARGTVKGFCAAHVWVQAGPFLT